MDIEVNLYNDTVKLGLSISELETLRRCLMTDYANCVEPIKSFVPAVHKVLTTAIHQMRAKDIVDNMQSAGANELLNEFNAFLSERASKNI